MWYIINIFTAALLHASASKLKSRYEKKRSSNILQNEIVLPKNKALSFLRTRRSEIQGGLREEFREECCVEDCTFKEIAILDDENSANRVLCEVSIQEGKSCTCGSAECGGEKFFKAFGKYKYYKADLYGTSHFKTFDWKCQNPCPHRQIWCGKGRECTKESNKCDSDKDCQEWYDERNCTIMNYVNFDNNKVIKGTRLVETRARQIECVFKSGDGSSSKETKEKNMSPNDCINHCIQKQKTHPSINGVAVDVNGGNLCYCEYNMTKWNPSSEWKSCKFSSSTELMTNKYWGNVYVLDRPVCDDNWDINDAKVICRSLKFPETTKAFAWSRGKFGTVGLKFRMDDVNCTGKETHIGQCFHVTSNDCNTYEGAGVTCVDTTTLDLRGGNYVTGNKNVEGNVYVIDQPVCDDNWNMKNAQVVCNQMFKSNFIKRSQKVVPVFEVWKGSQFGMSEKNTTSINNVNCEGTEPHLANCTFDVNVNCIPSKIAGVQCAKCTPDDLLEILSVLKIGVEVTDTHESILKAIQLLTDKCWEWDCSDKYLTGMGSYPEYCKVSAFLTEAKTLLESPNKTKTVINLETKFDYGELLNDYFMTQNTEILKDNIFKLGDGAAAFQTQTADHFKKLATYDKKKSEEDLRMISNLWQSIISDIEFRQNDLKGLLRNIFDYAIAIVANKHFELILDYVLRVSDLVNPAGWGGGTILDVKDVIKDMVKTVTVEIRLGVQMGKQVTHMNEVIVRIKNNRDVNIKKFGKIKSMLESRSMRTFTVQDANEFLANYKDFGTTSVGDISDYEDTLTGIVETACDIIENADSVIGATISIVAAAKASCPKVKNHLKVVVALYGDSIETQGNTMEIMSGIARAKIAEHGANAMSEVLGGSLNEVIERQCTRWEVLLLLRFHKISLIKRACDYITYSNHGKEESFCTDLLRNPDLHIKEELVSYAYERDMCSCSKCHTIHDVFRIPAAIQVGNTPLPKGTIDLSLLYKTNSTETDGWASFEIPNNKWLFDNEWVNSHIYDDGPIYLQKFQPYYPPTLEKKNSYAITTQMQLASNKWGEKSYVISEGVIMISRYEENRKYSCIDGHESLYNPPHCPRRLNKICDTMSAELSGPIYPLLVGSSWRIRLMSRAILTKPVPIENFFLKVTAKFCWKSSPVRLVRRSKLPRPNPVNRCCYQRKMYFNQVAKTDVGDKCTQCPAGSDPCLYGYYCEKCDAGYEPKPKKNYYGCVPCQKGSYKKDPGSSKCMPCPEGKTTILIGQAYCEERGNYPETSVLP